MAKNLTALRKSGAPTVKHLGSLLMDGASHLVVMRQTENWTNKTLVVTPCEEKFAFAAACAVPASTADANFSVILDNIATRFANGSWTDGQKAVFAYYTTWYDPLKVHADGDTSSTSPTEQRRAGMGMSVVALKFDLRALPLAAFDTGWTPYIRLHCPSHLYHQGVHTWIESEAYNFIGGCNTLRARVYAELPEHPSSIFSGPQAGAADPRAIVSLTPNGTNLNAGLAYGSDAPGYLVYDPFGDEGKGKGLEVDKCPLRVYADNTLQPTDYYYDMSLVDAAASNKSIIRSHTSGGFWVLIAFKRANGFQDGSYGMNLNYEQGHFLYIQRAELVLKNLTKARYNV